MTDALIARLEAATKGSRELDLAIAQEALGLRPIVTLRGTQVHNPKQPSSVSWDLKAYTTSLDAALTLVPEGLRWECGQTAATKTPWASVGAGQYSQRGATLALAICIAALKAGDKP